MGLLYKRTRLWINPGLQLRLMGRLSLYLLLYTYVVWHFAFLIEVAGVFPGGAPGKGIADLYLESLQKQAPFLWALAVMVPIVIYDLLKFSHRIAGPLHRARQLLLAMSEGKQVAPFTPRQHDLLDEMSQALNALIREWNARLEGAAAPAAAKASLPAAERVAVTMPGNGVVEAQQA
jgi:hypothetical protein